jgi:hypothetical protein
MPKNLSKIRAGNGTVGKRQWMGDSSTVFFFFVFEVKRKALFFYLLNVE